MPEQTNPGYAAAVATDQLVVVMDGNIAVVDYVDEPVTFDAVLDGIKKQVPASEMKTILALDE